MSLDLRGNGIRETGLVSLASFVAANDTLRTLCLEWNSAGLFDRGMEALVEALKDNHSLTSLDLRNNKIGPDGGVALGHMLSQNLTLASLGRCRKPVIAAARVTRACDCGRRSSRALTRTARALWPQICGGTQSDKPVARRWPTHVRDPLPLPPSPAATSRRSRCMCHPVSQNSALTKLHLSGNGVAEHTLRTIGTCPVTLPAASDHPSCVLRR